MNQGIKDLVISILPSLSDETLAHLLEVLEELGVENKEDLMLVEEKDIEKYLRPIQCRKLLAAFKNEGKSTRQGAMDMITIDKQADKIEGLKTKFNYYFRI